MKSKNQLINIKSLTVDIARRRRQQRITQKAFATLVGMKPSALSRLESGQYRYLPKRETLERIEHWLNLPDGFYTSWRSRIISGRGYDDSNAYNDPLNRLIPIYPDHTFDPEKLQRLIHELATKVDDYCRCERKLNFPSFDPFLLKDCEAESGSDGIDAADNLRDAVGINFAPIQSAIPLLEQVGIRIIPIDGLAPVVLKSSGRDQWRHAFPFHDRRCDNLVIAVNATSTAQDQLYDIAYSIAAYVRTRHFAITQRSPTNTDESEFCRAFAAELLTPNESLHELMGSLRVGDNELNAQILDAIAAAYGISATTLLWTLKGFGFIRPRNFKRLKAELPGIQSPDRPPLQFRTWLNILQLSATNAQL